uniref:vomeronasal type-2 receptor 116-like n=1 Tax=Jaculus jaculus TaxID=51337 RepID=UPI001E1B1AC1|nr:vomeronasal type-2 receptor 116-like [Jaculus jaculus]
MREINKNTHLLPNMSLTFKPQYIYEDMEKVKTTFSLLHSSDLNVPNYFCNKMESPLAVLTGPNWETSARFGIFLQLFSFPQITFGPFHPILSDQEQFPYLYQMAPKDTFLAHAMVSLMSHFSWTWVGLVILDDDQGIQFLSDMREEMQRQQVCSSFVNILPVSMHLFLTSAEVYDKRIVTSTANVVIIYGDMNSTLGLSFKRWEYLVMGRIWVTVSQWDIMGNRDFTQDLPHPTITFSHHHRDISDFKEFIWTVNTSKHIEDVLMPRFGWMHYNCASSASHCKTLKNCSSNGSLEWLPWHHFDMAMSSWSYNLYNAVYAVAQTLHEMLVQEVEMQQVVYWRGVTFSHLQVLKFIKHTQFINSVGDPVNINQKEKSDAEYDICSTWEFPQGIGIKVKIGQFSPHFPHGQQLYIYEDIIEWATGRKQVPLSVCSVPCRPGFRKSPQDGKADCCFDCTPCAENEISNVTYTDQCVKCSSDEYANTDQTQCIQKIVTFLDYEDPLGMALACAALCFSTLTALVLGIFVKHQDTPIVRANNHTLSYILLISLMCCFLCSLLFIGHPNTATCILQQITFGLVFTVAVSAVFTKTVTVVLAFKATAPGRRMRCLLVSGAPNFIIPICSLIQIILCTVWLRISPPFIDRDAHSEHGQITIMCNKGSATAFYCVLGYLGSLAIASFTVAFLARNLPDTFNEAKFLTFSMLVFCSVWVTFLPVYHSTKGKAMAAVEVFSILASSAGLLGCIFAPKCFIILFRPDRNSLQKFIYKAHT